MWKRRAETTKNNIFFCFDKLFSLRVNETACSPIQVTEEKAYDEYWWRFGLAGKGTQLRNFCTSNDYFENFTKTSSFEGLFLKPSNSCTSNDYSENFKLLYFEWFFLTSNSCTSNDYITKNSYFEGLFLKPSNSCTSNDYSENFKWLLCKIQTQIQTLVLRMIFLNFRLLYFEWLRHENFKLLYFKW